MFAQVAKNIFSTLWIRFLVYVFRAFVLVCTEARNGVIIKSILEKNLPPTSVENVQTITLL